MTRLALVRHGQTDWNLADRLQGSSDIPLNDTGRTQARAAGRLLADEHWDRIVTSPLQRAAETAQIIARELGLPAPTADAGLVERDYGAAEGLTRSQATERWGSDWPGEESYARLQVRAVTAVDRIAAQFPGERIVLVTHGTFTRGFADVVTGRETVKPDNGNSVRFQGEPGAWQATDGLHLVQ